MTRPLSIKLGFYTKYLFEGQYRGVPYFVKNKNVKRATLMKRIKKAEKENDEVDISKLLYKPRRNGNAKRFTVGDITDTLPGWSARSGIGYMTLQSRIKKQGLSMSEALSKDMRAKRPSEAQQEKDAVESQKFNDDKRQGSTFSPLENLINSLMGMGYKDDELLHEAKKRMVSL